MNCTVQQCEYFKVRGCAARDCKNYVMYRRGTGKCETCNQNIHDHPACDGCQIFVGSGHTDGSTFAFRGKQLCNTCMGGWVVLEKLVGRSVDWDDREFVRHSLRLREKDGHIRMEQLFAKGDDNDDE